MPRRKITLLMLLAILLPTLVGRGSGESSPEREDPFMIRPFEASSPDRWVNAVCYGPHRDGQRPGGPAPSAAEVREDLRLMAPHWRLLRLYGSSGAAGTILEGIRAERLALKVMLGVWIDREDSGANEREVAAGVRLADAYPELVVAVCVGNETQVSWSAHRCPPEQLIEQVRRVREKVSVPVTTADDFSYWVLPESRAVAAELDFITMHAHPLWNGRQLGEGLAWLQRQVAAVEALHPERAVVLGETGWATSVAAAGEQADLIRGVAGEAEQKIFYEQVLPWAEEQRLVTFWFEAFDENWKGGDDPAEVEKHWGLFRADRSPKAALARASSPD